MGRKTEKSQPKETEILKETIDKIVVQRAFEPYQQPTVGCKFLRFREPGETVIGFLGFPITNFRQGTSYPIQLEDDTIVEIVGNRMLHEQIRRGELCGRKVRIVYQGKKHCGRGYHRKIYRVFKYEEKPIPKAVWDKIIKESEKRRQKNGG